MEAALHLAALRALGDESWWDGAVLRPALVRERVIACGGRDGAKAGRTAQGRVPERQRRSLKITEDRRALACEYLQLGQGKCAVSV